jgi:signal transduction histidine kinase
MPSFHASEWYVLLRQPEDEALALVREFRKAFPLIIVLSLSVVVLLSFNLIRRSLVPIEILMGATRKIAEGECGHTIRIRSGDEFELLGSSFNNMSKKLEENQTLLVRTAKLSTMGQMAAGIIHEVRQPLTAISGLVQLSLLHERSPEQRRRLETAFAAVGRLDGILQRFRSFSQMSKEEMVPLGLEEIVDQAYALMEHQFRRAKIACAVHAEEGLPLVLGDPQGLHQVFSNLVLNAMQAMEGKPEGQRALDIRLHSSDGKVLAEIADTGCGMSPDVIRRVFDPFFTTKDRDGGTGLGMAIVESILHKHKATIDVKSEVGVGTTFRLAFAVASAESAAGAGPAR